MLIEAEGQLPATLCHLKASSAADSKCAFEPIIAAQEAFFLVQRLTSRE